MKKENNKVQATRKNLEIRPLGDRVLIKELDKNAESETKSGIIIPDTVSNDHGAKRGKVMAVGEGRCEDGKIIPIKVKVGETVLFQWGDQIEIDGEKYQIVGESNILAVIR